MGFGGATTSST